MLQRSDDLLGWCGLLNSIRQERLLITRLIGFISSRSFIASTRGSNQLLRRIRIGFGSRSIVLTGCLRITLKRVLLRARFGCDIGCWTQIGMPGDE
jgi:hypothetical protein